MFKRIHEKYPETKEALTFSIAICRELNLPYDKYMTKINRIEQDMMSMGGSMGYGYGMDDSYQDDYYEGGTAL